MSGLAKLFVLLAPIGFILAAVGNLWMGSSLGVGPEGFSRASTNLSLLAIAMTMVFVDQTSTVGSRSPAT